MAKQSPNFGQYNPGSPFQPTSEWSPMRLLPNKPPKPHAGEDWAGALIGTPVPAAGNGEVFMNQWINGYGNVVVLKHIAGDGSVFYTSYNHLQQKPDLFIGQLLMAGNTVGGVGNSGGDYPVHLHFEIITDLSKGIGLKDNSNPMLGYKQVTANPETFNFKDVLHMIGTDSKGNPLLEKTVNNAGSNESSIYVGSRFDNSLQWLGNRLNNGLSTTVTSQDVSLILRDNGLERWQLQAANLGVDLDHLTIGQKLNLPSVNNGLTITNTTLAPNFNVKAPVSQTPVSQDNTTLINNGISNVQGLGNVNTATGTYAFINDFIADYNRPGNGNLTSNNYLFDFSSINFIGLNSSGVSLGANGLNNASSGLLNFIPTDPLILDLNGDGVKLTNYRDAPVLFDIDHDSDATKEQTGWVSAQDGIVVYDRNGNGKIDNISETLSEYFGGVKGTNGGAGTKPFANGLTALKSLDTNNDNQFTNADTQWANIKVWVDANHDGITDTGELKTLSSLNITSVNLNQTTQSGLVRDGNEILASSTFIQNGQSKEALAASFIANPNGSNFTVSGTGTLTTTEGNVKSYTAGNGGETVDVAQKGVNNAQGGSGNDTLIGDGNNNWLAGSLGADTINAGAGDDVILFDSQDIIDGGDGMDIAQVVGSEGVILNLTQTKVEAAVGGRGDDILIGGGRSTVFVKAGDGDDIVIGGAANDVLSGENGDDIIDGGASNDLIRGHQGRDQLMGGSGDDIIEGGQDDDSLVGGDGNDALSGDSGDDSIDGGAGDDIAKFSGSYGDYRFVRTGEGIYVIDTLGRNGTDFLVNVESLSFDDVSWLKLDNPAPVAVDDVVKVASRSSAITINASTLLGNDVDIQKNDALSIASVSNAKGGTVSINASGNVVFTPTAGYSGVLSFMYTTKDAAGNVANVTYEATGQSGTRKATVTLLTPELPTDPLFTKQWYLNETKVTSVWQEFTGKGVAIGQFEPGNNFSVGAEIFDYRHYDLKGSVNADWLSTSLPPTTFSQHATLVAGVMVADRNGEGSVGVAYDASLAGYYIANNGSDFSNLSKFGQFDVVNNSWGGSNAFAFRFDQSFARGDYVNAVRYGRGSLGTVIVSAGGNSRQTGGNANYDNLINNRYSIQVGAINALGDAGALVLGQKPFSNPGASILVSAPGSNVASTATQLINQNGSVFGSDFNTVMGTSFATPLVSGVVALMLEANPNLGYRDVQAILAMTAKSITDPNGTDWIVNGSKNWNGGGMHTSHDYGFGQVDALAAVRLAETWSKQSTAANEVTISASSSILNQSIIDGPGVLTNALTMGAGVIVEHAEVTVNLKHQQAGDLIIRLISPSGTSSILANRPGKAPGSAATERGDDTFSGSENLNFTFMTTHKWGEKSGGVWKLEVVDAATKEVGTLNSWSLQLFGQAETSDDVYVYTDEYATVRAALAARGTLSDTNGGKDTINASSVTGNSTINISTGNSSIGGTALTVSIPANIENIISGDGNDTLTGNASNNLIYAGRGVNTLTGGTGSDVFIVKLRANGSDTIVDFNPSQNDAIIIVGDSSVTFADLNISQVGTSVNINLGNGQNIILQGRNVGDLNPSQFLFQQKLTLPSAYIDSSFSYSNGIIGSTINGDANSNVIAGGNGNDIISGFAGDDEIRAGAGNDIVDGGTGVDKLYGDAGDDTIYLDGDSSGFTLSSSGMSFTGGQSWGGAGNERFIVRAGVANTFSNIIGDFEATNVNERIDLSQVGIKSFSELTFGSVMLNGTNMVTINGNLNGTQVVLANLLGLTSANLSASNFIFASQPVVEPISQPAPGTTGVLTSGNNLTGNAGGNVLDGGVGAQIMDGRTGDDTYIVDNYADIVLEQAEGGFDAVKSSISYALSANVENLELLGSLNINATGNELRNRLVGNAGNNFIDGGLNSDVMVGGAGDDQYYVDEMTDVVIESENNGIDTVLASKSFILSGNIENLTLTGNESINATGNHLSNNLTGNSGDNRLDGASGADFMSGGHGNDTYFVDNVSDLISESIDQGIDTVISSINITLAANLEQLIIADAATQGTGNANDNVLIGNNLNNTLTGLSGSDYLDGGLGVDTLIGGDGDDTYVVDSTSDVLAETATAGAGVDTVQSSVTYTLGTNSNLENLTLTGTAAINATGNALNNVITGNSGNNVINGLAGNDTMIGGLGDDTYTIDVLTDVVTENANEGTDLINVAIATANGSYTLAANVENATLTNTVAYTLTGNAFNNVLTGNAAANTLNGGDGNDTLNGLAGVDTMIGGLGDDTYTVDVATDIVTENLDQGIDTVNIAYSNGAYILGANIENAILTNAVAYNLTGNAQDNTLIGNAAANVLDGGLGADTMIGGVGADTYLVDNIGDTVVETTVAAETDLVQSSISYSLGINLENLTLTGTSHINGTGNTANNAIIGNSGNNILDGGAGVDTLTGGAGNDTYFVDLTATNALQDTVVEAASGGVDTIIIRNQTLTAVVSNLVIGTEIDHLDASLTTTAVINITGNALANEIKGNSGNNIINGLGGNDTMIGGLGDDTYTIDVLTDAVTENANEGTDLINVAISTASGSYTLAANVENATLTNTVAYSLTGNALNNVLTGNAAANTLNGGDGNDTLNGLGGIDTMVGGLGNDTYVIDVTTDVVTEAVSAGTDTVNVAVATAGGTYTVAANVENARLINTVAYSLTGNALTNYLLGNALNNTLTDTAGGNDIFQGLAGVDTFNDTVGNNLIDGGVGADLITAGTGRDLIIGGKDNDTMTTGDGFDVILFNKGDGVDTLNASVGTDNTLSLGGNFAYSDLSLTKSTADLILKMGTSDQITIKGWYNTAANNKSVLNLQVIAEAMQGFSLGGTDVLRNNKVETFNFANIVAAFDVAGATANWQLTDARLSAHLSSGSDASAIGGDIAYQYGKAGSLTGIGLLAAQAVMNNASVGQSAQTLNASSSWSAETIKLS